MQKYNPEIHKRRSVRLKNYDYSQEGLYFVTICCQDKANLFGEIENGQMILNDLGKVVKQCWEETPKIRPNVVLHQFVVMPNHFHAIVEIVEIAHRRGVLHTPDENEPNRNGELHSPDENEMNCNGELRTPNNNETHRRGELHTPDESETHRNGKLHSPNDNETNAMVVLHTPNDNLPHNDENNLNDMQKGVFNTPLRSPSQTLGAIVRGFKSAVSKNAGFSVWQRNYHEHIIRNEQSYFKIAEYIENNPLKWEEDCFYL